MYILKEYSSYYSETTGILWRFSKDEVTNFSNRIQTLIILNLSSIKLSY